MIMNQDKETAILEITEEMVRQGGYNSFSFRNIATAIGIKSSSVHYHFSTKEDLGVAVTQYYTTKFLQALGEPNIHQAKGENPVQFYIAAFRNALAENKGMCLCGMLGAEADGLPDRVVNEICAFFDKNLEWLKRAYHEIGLTDQSEQRAIQTISLLQGAMILSNANDSNLDFFDAATLLLIKDVTQSA